MLQVEAATCLYESRDLTEVVEAPGFVGHSCMAVSQMFSFSL